jgi:hypothetical protein
VIVVEHGVLLVALASYGPVPSLALPLVLLSHSVDGSVRRGGTGASVCPAGGSGDVGVGLGGVGELDLCCNAALAGPGLGDISVLLLPMARKCRRVGGAEIAVRRIVLAFESLLPSAASREPVSRHDP